MKVDIVILFSVMFLIFLGYILFNWIYSMPLYHLTNPKWIGVLITLILTSLIIALCSIPTFSVFEWIINYIN